MGFINSATTINVDVHLTSEGRRRLLTAGAGTFTNFGLGDSDINYKVAIPNSGTGWIPDLTGDHLECINSMSDKISIKYPLLYGNVPSSGTTNNFNSEVVLFFNDCNNLVFWNEAEVDIYLHDYLTLQKFLVNLKSVSAHGNSDWYLNFKNTFTGLTNQINSVLGTTEETLYYNLEKLGRGVFFDFFDFVKIKQGGKFIDDDFEVVLDRANKEAYLALTQSYYLLDTETSYTLDGENFDFDNTTFLSPFNISFGSRTALGREYRGAGAAGISLHGFDYGYILGNENILTNPVYPNYLFNGIAGYYTAFSIEQSVDNFTNINNLIPSARIQSVQDGSYYYPFNRTVLGIQTQGTIIDNSNIIRITKTPTALETYAMFNTNVEYSLQNSVIKPTKAITNTSQEPALLLTRQIKYVDEFFSALTNNDKYRRLRDNGLVNIISTSTSGDTVSLSLTLEIKSVNNLVAKPGRVKVNFIYNKTAFSHNAPVDFTDGTRKLFDNSTYRYYGDDLGTGSNFTTNPQNFTFNSGNNNIFRNIKGLTV